MAHIVRIDQPKNDPTKGTHGWQVRVGGSRGYHSKLFSDNVYGSKGKALVAAEEYLEQYLKDHPEEAQRRTKPLWPPYRQFNNGKKVQANNKSGVNGVHKTYTYNSWDKKRKHKAWYWAAFCPIGPEGQRNRWFKRFYVDSHGDAEARRLAIEFRKMWEEAVEKGEDALKEFFDREHYDKMVDTRFGSDDRAE